MGHPAYASLSTILWYRSVNFEIKRQVGVQFVILSVDCQAIVARGTENCVKLEIRRSNLSFVKLSVTELVKIPSNRRKISCVARIRNRGGKALDCVTSYSGEFDQTQRNRSRGPHARTIWSVMRVMKDGSPLSDVEQTSRMLQSQTGPNGYVLFAQKFEKVSSFLHVRKRVNDDFDRITESRSSTFSTNDLCWNVLRA